MGSFVAMFSYLQESRRRTSASGPGGFEVRGAQQFNHLRHEIEQLRSQLSAALDLDDRGRGDNRSDCRKRLERDTGKRFQRSGGKNFESEMHNNLIKIHL